MRVLHTVTIIWLLPLPTDLNDRSFGVDGGGGTRGGEQEESYQEEEKMAHLMTMRIGKRQALVWKEGRNEWERRR